MKVSTSTRQMISRNTKFCEAPLARQPDAGCDGRRAIDPGPDRHQRNEQAGKDHATHKRAVQRERSDADRRVGDDLLQPQEIPRRFGRIRCDQRVGGLLERRRDEDRHDADDGNRAERGNRGAAYEVGNRIHRSVRCLEALRRHRRRGAADDAQQRVGLGRHDLGGAWRVEHDSRASARASPPSFLTRHMWYANSTPRSPGRNTTCST